MKRNLVFAGILHLVFLLTAFGQITLPFSETFNSSYSSNFYSSSGTSNAGATYTCTSANGVGLMTSSSYFVTKTLYVPQGQAVSLTFKMNKGGSYSGPVDVYLRVNSATTYSSISPTNNGWTKIGTASTFSCGTNTFNLPSEISGGQRISFAIDFKNPSSTNWVAIEDLSVTGTAGSGVPTSFVENFTANAWYPTSGYVKIPYHSYTTASNGYTWLFSNGTGGPSDYCAAFYTGFDGSSGTHLITPEINTAGYANGELRFAFKSQYPCGGPNSYTFDETYDFYAPEVYIMQGADNGSNSWIQLPVQYYFPDATWRYVSVDISAYKTANVKFKFERGGFCSAPVEQVDNIKVFDRNCTISNQPAGTITGPANIAANTNYAYSTSAVAGATYYKWMVRNGGTIYTGAPYIVLGQGTANATINFGNLSTPLRVMCQAFDADPTSNNDVCYAQLGYLSMSGCVPDTADVSILATTPTTICPGVQVDFTATPVNGGSTPTYQWKVNGNNAGTNSPNFSSTSLNNNDAVTCEMTSNAACVTNSPATSNVVMITVTTNGTASVSIAPTTATTACAGTAIGFMATPTNGGTAPSYQWKVNGNNAGTNSPNFSSSALSNNDAIICIMTSNEVCIGGSPATSNSVVVTINPAPSVAISNPAPICAGGSAMLTASGGGTYLWSNAETTASITVSPGATTTYTVTVTNANSCTASASRNILVSTGLTGSISPATAPVCTGNSITLTAAGGTNYSWSNAETTAAITVSPTTNSTYTVTITYGSCVDTISRTVTVNSNPTVAINANGNISFCPGDSVEIVSSGSGGVTYQWLRNGQPVGANSPVYFASISGSFSVSVTNSNGCTGISNVISTTLNALPTQPSVINGPNVLCEGATVTYSVASVQGAFYSWTLPAGWNGAGNTATIGVQASHLGGNVEVTVTNQCGTSQPAIASVIVNTKPVVTLDSFVTVCTAEPSFTLGGGSPVGGTYYINGAPSVTFNPAVGVGNYTITYQYTDNNGCSANAIANQYVDICSGLTGIGSTDFKLYPNPASGFITVVTDRINLDNTTIIIYDAVGKMLKKVMLDAIFESHVDISGVESGIYWVELRLNGKRSLRKLAIVR